MAQAGDVIQNPLTGERLTFLKTSGDSDGELLLIDWFLNPGGFLPGGAHVHPYQEEYFEVISGTLGVRVGRRKCILRAGEAATVPPGTLHGWWNESSDEVHAIIEFRPALDTESLFETLYGLMRDGKTTGKGVPHPLQVLAVLEEYKNEIAIPLVPIRMQRAIISTLSPLALRRGYRGRYFSTAARSES
jgi:quercetin dioxygenase-like cupin family protein